jgi:hypothetical protein
MIPRILTMIPGFERTGFGRDEIYPDTCIKIYNSIPIYIPILLMIGGEILILIGPQGLSWS